TRKIRAQPPDDGVGVRGRRNIDPAVAGLFRNHRDALRNGRDQRMAAGIVGVLAEDLDAAGNESAPAHAHSRTCVPASAASTAATSARVDRSSTSPRTGTTSIQVVRAASPAA